MKSIHAAVFLLFLAPFLLVSAEASHNPYLFVSAENSQFNNHFSGSMVVEVIIRDPGLRDTDEGKGEPDVTLNGKTLRMVQATDGNWYAYFAHVDYAEAADDTVGLAGQGLDFGSICTPSQAQTDVGISFSDTDAVALNASDCSGTSSDVINVVRNERSPNTGISSIGQVGLNSANDWPFIQLFSFDDVKIQYNAAGGPQSVDLEYDEIPNITMSIDRELYPRNADVFLTIKDFQLNQDPTDEDSWTFNIKSPVTTFYQAFDESGNDAANGNAGLVNLASSLSNLGFENNGMLTINLGSVMELQTNNNQPDSSVDNDGSSNTYSNIVTLVEQGPNSGIFTSYDHSDQSVIGIKSDAPRGQTGQITYNKKSISVLSGFSTASVSVDGTTLTINNGNPINPGTEYPVVLQDPDQNLNTGARDHLDVFRDTAMIPTIVIGKPLTLQSGTDVEFHSTSPTLTAGKDAKSSLPDPKSKRLMIDTSSVANGSYEMISINLGTTVSNLSQILLDDSDSNVDGTNWINYDLRSFERDLGVSDFSDTSFSLYFGSLTGSSITIIDAGDISSAQGFVQIDTSDVSDILDKSGQVFLVIDFDSSNNDSGEISISSETTKQPIIFDIFSFGLDNNQSINNSIYRFELEETQDNSSVFDGTIEYAVANQLNITDPDFIKTIQTIGDEVKIIITNRLIDEKGIKISYSDIDDTGVTTTTSAQSDLRTHSGTVSTSSSSFRFGQPVTITLKDPDLNLKSDRRDIYQVINDPNSSNVDTVGQNGKILLEVKLKDVRYKRCTINGVQHGGLAATGFTLVETGPSTGVFEGVFKMPNRICNKAGTELISTAGGSLDVIYHDSRDASGNSNIFSLLRSQSTPSLSSSAQLSHEVITLPSIGNTKEIILSGNIQYHQRGVPVSVLLTYPDGTSQNFAANVNSNGSYRAAFTVNSDSSPGEYKIRLSYDGKLIENLSFKVAATSIPDWVKNTARQWSSDAVSKSDFINGIEHLIDTGIISAPVSDQDEPHVPDWIKSTAKWWASDQISDNDFKKALEYLVKKGIIRV
ncbi:MAG: peptidase [Nitrosopumilaceae archaeon]|nr:peptidase [Nitrosopumilaceae archaeon]